MSSKMKQTVEEDKTKKILNPLPYVCERPSKGKSGKVVKVVSNTYRVKVPLAQIHAYTVEFQPNLPEDATSQRRSVINRKCFRDKIEKHYGIWFFDNTRIWALKLKTEDSSYTNEELDQTIAITYQSSVDMDKLTQDGLEQYQQIIHIILNKAITATNLMRIGAHYYERNEPLFGRKGPLDIVMDRMPPIRLWRGFTISMEETIKGTKLKVDVNHRVLYQQNVSEQIKQTFQSARRSTSNNDQAVKKAQRQIENMLIYSAVMTVYNKRVYRITGVDWTIGVKDTFIMKGKKVSYYDYFKKQYGETCEQTFRGMLLNTNKRGQNIVLPPELCHLTGLSKKLKSNFTFMKAMADKTRIPASSRHTMGSNLVKRIQKSIGQDSNYDNDSADGSQKGKELRADSNQNQGNDTESVSSSTNSESTSIPLLIEDEAVQLNGRVLPEYSVLIADKDGKSSYVSPYKELASSWDDAGFINKQKIPISKWAILCEDKFMVNKCLAQIRNVCVMLGLWGTYINNSPEQVIVQYRKSYRGASSEDAETRAWKIAMEKTIKEVNPSMMLCILPSDRNGYPTAVYNKIKTYCLTVNPVLTQCIQDRSLKNARRVRSIIKGVCKQMLVKMGNTPARVKISLPDNSIDIKKSPTMVCGMDVSHDSRRNTSTVSFVASYSSDFTKYFASVQFQKLGKEAMIDGGKLITDAVNKFKTKWKYFPKQIIIYRDGVSTAQISNIVFYEVSEIKKALANYLVNGKKYEPKITVIVVQKRVSARFLDTKFNSLNPGTVIDSEVVSSQFWDFYIIPCEVPYRGTAIPTRFIVAYDEIGFSQDDISALSNQLCANYHNCGKAVRVPAPVQYAHKLGHMWGTSINQRVPCQKLNGSLYFL